MNKRTALFLLVLAIIVLMAGFWDLNIGDPEKWLLDYVEGERFLTKSIYSFLVFGAAGGLTLLGLMFAVRGDKE